MDPNFYIFVSWFQSSRSKSLAKKIGNVGNRTSAFFPVISRHHPVSVPSVVAEEEANVNLSATSPAPPPPLPPSPLTFPEGMSSVQNKGFYVMQNESSMGSQGSRGSHGVGMRGIAPMYWYLPLGREGEQILLQTDPIYKIREKSLTTPLHHTLTDLAI